MPVKVPSHKPEYVVCVHIGGKHVAQHLPDSVGSGQWKLLPDREQISEVPSGGRIPDNELSDSILWGGVVGYWT